MKIILPIVLFFSLGISSVLAQGGSAPTGPGGTAPTSPPVNVTVTLDNPFNVGGNLYDVAKAIVNNVVLPIGGVLCVLAFIYAGFLYVTAQGNTNKIATANKALLYAAIGTAVLLGAWAIATVIQNTVGKLIT